MPPVVPIRDDFPDWGAAPSSLTYNPRVIAVTGGSTEVVRFDMGNYQYGVLYVASGGTVVDNELAFEWKGTVGAEADTIMSNDFVRLNNGTIVLPFQCLTPTLRLLDVDSSVYPYNLSVGLTLFTNSPYQHGFPGGIFAVNDNRTIALLATATYMPLGCGPGEHVFNIGTTSTNYDVSFVIYLARLQPITIPWATAQSGPLGGGVITLPATQWVMTIKNNAANALFVVAVTRTPDPT